MHLKGEKESDGQATHPKSKTTLHAQRDTIRRSDPVKRSPGWLSLFAFTTKQHITPCCTAVLLSIASGAISPVLAILLGKIINSFTDFASGKLDNIELHNDVSRNSSFLALLGLATWLLKGAFFSSWLLFGELQARSCSGRIFEALVYKPTEWYDTRKSGTQALVPRLQAQIRELQLATSQPLGFAVQYTVTTLAALATALYYCWNLTLVILATVPVLAIFLSTISSRMQPSIESQQQDLSIASKNATNAIAAIETVKCFNGQDCEVEKYTDSIRRAARHFLSQARANAMQIGFVRFTTLCLFVQGFWYGNHLVVSASSTTGAVITTFWSCLTATQAIEEILPHMIVLEKGRAAGAALRTIIAVIQSNQSKPEVKGGRVPTKCVGHIELRDVSFAYPTRPQEMAIKNVSCVFPSGTMTFIVGKSGSGKSTVGQLLLRFYSPLTGNVFLDGVPILELDCGWVRQNIMLVEQQSVLFDGSIFDNIAMGRGDPSQVTEEEVKQSAEFALLQQTIIDLPQGLNSFVSGKGTSLSGGQKQRIGLARARLRDSPVLILDESTSALDQTSRSLIMTAIRHWRKGKTTIIISHDISQIESRDFIYLFHNGKLVQQGYRDVFEEEEESMFSKFLPTHASSSQLSDCDRTDTATELSFYPSDLYQSSSSVSMGSVDLIDSLNNHLNNKRISTMPFIPSVFSDRAPESFTTFGFVNAVVPAASSFAKTSPLPNYKSAREPNQELRHPLHSSPVWEESNPNRVYTKRVSQGAMELLEMAGAVAMENRVILTKRINTPLSDPFRLPVGGDGLADRRKTGTWQAGTMPGTDGSRPSIRTVLKTVWPSLNSRSRMLLIIGFLSAALHAVATPIFSWIFSKLLATFFLPDGSSQALKWSLAILGVAVTDGLVSYLMHILLEFCGQVWVDGMRIQAMKRILDQPQQFFSETENDTSQLAQTLDRNAEEMRNLLGRFAAFIFVAFIMMTVALVWSLAGCWKLTLVGLSIAPLSFTITRGYQTVSSRMESKCNDAAAIASSVVHETLTHMKTVRALTLEKYFREKHTKATRHTIRVGLLRALLCGIFFGLAESLVIFVMALIFYYGAVVAASLLFSVQDILLVFSMLLFSMSNLTAIISFIPQINSSRDTAIRLLQLVQLPQTSHEQDGTARASKIGDIVMENLVFSYPSQPDERVLRGLDLSLPSGSCTAVVGSSGSGKSTIAALLLRLYPTSNSRPSDGPQISLSGRDIKYFHTPTLRNLITIVSQTTILFPTTVSKNITYGLPMESCFNTIAKIRAAAAAAGIDDFIMSLPEGYETLVGDGGMGLSGGQAQRLAIARALVRNPAVLILDEATSALDVESAGLVRQSIQRLRREHSNITIIIITHSSDMMRIADRVVMLDHGQIVEEGTFDELLAENGRFTGLLNGGQWVAESNVRRLRRRPAPRDADWHGEKITRSMD